MKKYQSHKIVEAAPIIGYTALGNYVNVEADNDDGYERIAVPGDFFARGNPDLGDYLVRYQPDGYLSWSPKAVFEAGYRQVGEPAAEEDRSEIAAMVVSASKLVAVTVSAPAGKRGIVVRQRADGSSTTSTVVGGTSSTVSIEPGDIIVVSEGAPHSTVAHKREDG